MRTKFLLPIAAFGAGALLLAGCSGSSSSESTSSPTVAPTTSAPATSAPATSAPATSAPASSSGFPTPPSGASELNSSDNNGVQYARYSIEGQQPSQVVSHYTNLWQGEGYTINSSGGGGGGWGQYGGSGAGASGSKSGSFVAVQAGGQSGSTTYFEVCQGANEQAVDQCGNDNDDNDQNQNQNQNQNENQNQNDNQNQDDN